MGSGGARDGAGRRAHKVKAGGLLFIDVRQFARLGYLAKDSAFAWVWRRQGQVTASIHIYAQGKAPMEHFIRLVYTTRSDGIELDYNDRVDLAYTACNFGKVRPWFVCPHCYQRKAKLYMRRGYFACRHCHKVAYNSQSQDAIDRTWAVQYKIEARIGEKHKRPKGMHHKTFEALRAKLYQCMWLRDMAIDARMAQLGGLLEQIEARMSV